MSHLSLGLPSFARAQTVRLVGGEGLICSDTAEVGKGTSLLKRDLGAAPTYGRVGAATMLWLHEAALPATEPFEPLN